MKTVDLAEHGPVSWNTRHSVYWTNICAGGLNDTIRRKGRYHVRTVQVGYLPIHLWLLCKWKRYLKKNCFARPKHFWFLYWCPCWHYLPALWIVDGLRKAVMVPCVPLCIRDALAIACAMLGNYKTKETTGPQHITWLFRVCNWNSKFKVNNPCGISSVLQKTWCIFWKHISNISRWLLMYTNSQKSGHVIDLIFVSYGLF